MNRAYKNFIESSINSLKKNEILFNQKRTEQICEYLVSCKRVIAKTIINIHPIISEVLRNANIKGFKKSNIETIIGYGLNKDVGLEIKPVKGNLQKLLIKTVTRDNRLSWL